MQQADYVTAAQLSQLNYVAGSGADTLWVKAYDGTLWSNWSSAFTVTPGPDQAPVTTASNVILDHSQTSVAASSLFAVNDPEGDTITQYDVWNSGTGGGHFELNGQALGANQHNYVTAAQLSQLSYVAGTGADTLWVRASDGTKWSGWTSGGFTVNRPDQAPVTTASNVILDHGQTSLAASSLFTANDPDQADTITQYAVWNSGTGGGHFELNGQALGVRARPTM